MVDDRLAEPFNNPWEVSGSNLRASQDLHWKSWKMVITMEKHSKNISYSFYAKVGGDKKP